MNVIDCVMLDLKGESGPDDNQARYNAIGPGSNMTNGIRRTKENSIP